MLDEPTVGADVVTRALLIESVKELAAEGAAVIYTTHYLPEVEALSAEVVIIDDGRILARGSQAELVEAQELHGVSCSLDGELPYEAFADLRVTQMERSSGEPDGQANTVNHYRILGDLSIPELIARLGSQTSDLRSVEALRPNLEEVFVAITGGRISAGRREGGRS